MIGYWLLRLSVKVFHPCVGWGDSLLGRHQFVFLDRSTGGLVEQLMCDAEALVWQMISANALGRK